MPFFTLKQLQEPPTEDEALSELKTLLTDAGLDTTSWKPGSVQLTLLKLPAFLYSKACQRAASIASFIYNNTATGDELADLSDSFFDNQKLLATPTIGTMRMTLLPGASTTVDMAFREVQVDFQGKTYTNITSGTLIPNVMTMVTMSFQADTAGSAGNIDSNLTGSAVTQLAGVEITNPFVTDSDTWITSLGTDAEDDVTLRLRNSTKWSTLATGEIVYDRVTQIALSASNGVKHVFTDDQNPRGAGTVDVYVAGDLFTAATDDVTAVYTRLTGSFFGDGANRIQALPAPEYVFPYLLTAYYSPAYSLVEVTSAVEQALDDLVSNIPIGGFDLSPLGTNLVQAQDIIVAVEDLAEIRSVSLLNSDGTSPANDTTLANNQKFAKPGAGWSSVVSYTVLNKA